MRNPDDDTLLSYELQPVPPQKSIALVWLLNLIPYLGAGYWYALGPAKAMRPMLFFFFFMIILGPGTLVPMYFILSALATAHLLNTGMAEREKALRFRETITSDDLQQVPRGKQVSLSDSPEFAAASLMNKIHQRKIKSLNAETDDQSNHALEAFEYKAQAAERQLRAREEAEAKAARAQVPPERDAESTGDGLVVVPQNGDTNNLQNDISAVVSSDSSDYINRINSSYSMDAEVARITSGVNRGASAETGAVNKTVAEEISAVNAAVPAQSPNLVPGVDAVLVDSNQFVPDVGAVLANSEQLTPDVSSVLVDSTQATPDVSSQLFDSTQATPDVSSQVIDSTQATPDVSSQLIDSTQATPDVSSQLVGSTRAAPDVSSQVAASTQATPSVSVGDFELPTFSFSFDDHMAAPLSVEGAGGATTKSSPCSKCGAARDPNFSFCLACGQSFL